MSTALDTLARSGRLRRVDAALGDWIAREFSDAAHEVALAGALAARAVGDGHSALELARAQDWFSQLEGSGPPPNLPSPDAWQAALRAAPGVCRPGDADTIAPLTLDAQGRVYLSRYFEYERQLARKLATVVQRPDPSPSPHTGKADVRTARVGVGKEELASEQQRAIDVAMTHRFALITGCPGSGKTYSVAHMLAALARNGNARGASPRIALAAPTGKAAARLAESLRAQVARMQLPEATAAALPHDASTLHRLLGISPWHARPRHHREVPLPFDVVVVDEASMVDLPLMTRLADALAPDARLILLGDPDQLSAVEAGNVLPALVEAASAPPFAACHVALVRSHRFGTDSALGKLAHAIVGGDADAALANLRAGEDGVSLIDDAASLVDSASSGYAPVFASRDPTAALAAARGYRVLTALRHGPRGCIAMDRTIGARLKRAHGLRADAEWWPGRLVLVTANRPELNLYNGDTGVVWPDADGITMKTWFEGADGTPRALPVAALPPHEGAFALTVHKAQGSEFGHVALVAGPDSAALTRELLYTGVTRARTGITLYSDPETLRVGIGRRTLRMAGLADRLREAAPPPPVR